MDDKERFDLLKRLHESTGSLNYHLEVFGFHVAKRERYKDPALHGMEAIYFYLVQKYRWLPSQVRAMNLEDIRFVLSEEMNGWTVPTEAR
jgi:hypothetical protein